MSKQTKAELQEELLKLQYDYEVLTQEYLKAVAQPKKAPEIPTVKKNARVKYDRHWTLSFELNPLKWWKLYSYRYNWQKHAPESPVREGQIDLGPVSLSWYRDRV